jgi:hypothetical protein
MKNLLLQLGFEPDARVAIYHADDVGMCHGANAAFEELSGLGTITCGAVMVPCPWFLEAAEMAARDSRLDLGVHLTLTSEWATYRWAPISTVSRASGLIDESGYFWRRLPMLGPKVVPEAAEAEMRAQIERALAAGINVTHLDTHMGAALLPQLLGIYLRLGREYRLPVLFPKNLQDYTSVLGFEGVPLEGYFELLGTLQSEEWPLVDHFRMSPWAAKEDTDRVYREMMAALPSGLTMIALHPTQGGEIEAIAPVKAHCRTEEYRLLKDPDFKNFVSDQGIRPIGFRPLRDLLRKQPPGSAIPGS